MSADRDTKGENAAEAERLVRGMELLREDIEDGSVPKRKGGREYRRMSARLMQLVKERERGH